MNGLDKVIEHLNHAHLDALLNPPTNDMILEHLKKEMGHIPADYIEFLKQCNGLTLYHSGDYCLFDAQEILSFHFSNDNLLCRSAWKIGYWMGYDIVINVDDIEKEYLYAGDCCSTDEFICVGNILNFIEEIVKTSIFPPLINDTTFLFFSFNFFNSINVDKASIGESAIGSIPSKYFSTTLTVTGGASFKVSSLK